MSRFRKVAAGTWGDERFRSLSEPAQRLWLYLLTGNEVTSLPGILVIGRAGLAEALDWTLPKLDRCFKELVQATNAEGVPMAKADWRARVVWLPKGYKHNAPANPNVVRGWKDLWRSVPECALKHEALIVLRSFMQEIGEPFASVFNEVIDTYDSVRYRRDEQARNTAHVESETVPVTVPVLSPQTSPEPSLARARTATAPSTASAPDTSRVSPPEPIADATGPAVEMGTARCQAVCETFVAALGEAGWSRGPVRQAWERQALCDAINANLRADGTAEGILAELRRAVSDWVAAYRDRQRFTSGWGARKFADWLAEGRECAVERSQPAKPSLQSRGGPDPEPDGNYTPPTPEEAAELEQALATMLSPPSAPAASRTTPGQDLPPDEVARLDAKRKADVAKLRALEAGHADQATGTDARGR